MLRLLLLRTLSENRQASKLRLRRGARGSHSRSPQAQAPKLRRRLLLLLLRLLRLRLRLRLRHATAKTRLRTAHLALTQPAERHCTCLRRRLLVEKRPFPRLAGLGATWSGVGEHDGGLKVM